jgi:two-component system CheB/CheR fusion protein
LVVFNDITEIKAREEQLERAAAAASEAVRRKDEFVAVLSRALRGPLAPIRHCLFVLARVAPTSEQAERAKTVIDRGVRHLTRLVDDLLGLTRTTRGKLRLRREQIDFCELVRGAVEQHGRSCRAKAITLATSLPEAPLWAYADPARLGEAVGTLLANVERFTPRGGRIVVALARVGERARLRVSVEVRTGSAEAGRVGKGQPAPPLVPASQSIERASAGGLGLGLAMLKGELELHGGSVAVESDERGRGRAIALVVPLEDPPSTAGDAQAQRAPGRKVLVIEDFPDAADSLRDALQLLGHHVEVAYDGPSGLTLARRFRPDIVICDIEMPGMDGYEVAHGFRVDDCLSETFLIALTGHAGPGDLERAKHAGFDEHLAKPATIESLQSLLHDVSP